MARAKTPDGIAVVFVRDTLPREGEVQFKAGETAELTQSQYDRWTRRGACVTQAEADALAAVEAEAAGAEPENEAEAGGDGEE